MQNSPKYTALEIAQFLLLGTQELRQHGVGSPYSAVISEEVCDAILYDREARSLLAEHGIELIANKKSSR